MSGAFLVWDHLLLALCQSIVPVTTLLERLTTFINASARSMVSTDQDPIKEGLRDWIVHILCSNEWHTHQSSKLIEDTLMQYFSNPTHWNIRIAEALLQGGDVRDRQQWLAVLEAAKNDKQDHGEEMEVDVEDIEEARPVGVEVEAGEKMSGPHKVMGMWKPRPIGWLPEGWESDE